MKHGYVMLPEEWQQSTYRFWVEKGYYVDDWGVDDEPENIFGMDIE